MTNLILCFYLFLRKISKKKKKTQDSINWNMHLQNTNRKKYIQHKINLPAKLSSIKLLSHIRFIKKYSTNSCFSIILSDYDCQFNSFCVLPNE